MSLMNVLWTDCTVCGWQTPLHKTLQETNFLVTSVVNMTKSRNTLITLNYSSNNLKKSYSESRHTCIFKHNISFKRIFNLLNFFPNMYLFNTLNLFCLLSVLQKCIFKVFLNIKVKSEVCMWYCFHGNSIMCEPSNLKYVHLLS